MQSTILVGPEEKLVQVSQLSKSRGEVPIYLKLGRTQFATYSRSKKPVEYWKVVSSNIIKVSWNEPLAVLSVAYKEEKNGEEKKRAKVFFIPPDEAFKVIRFYQKVKPDQVVFSPGGPNSTNSKTKSRRPPSCYFTRKDGKEGEMFWKLWQFSDTGLSGCEVIFGLHKDGIHAFETKTGNESWKIDKLNLMDIRIDESYLICIYIGGKKHNKTKYKFFTAHPATLSDVKRQYRRINSAINATFESKEGAQTAPPKKVINFVLPDHFKEKLKEMEKNLATSSSAPVITDAIDSSILSPKRGVGSPTMCSPRSRSAIKAVSTNSLPKLKSPEEKAAMMKRSISTYEGALPTMNASDFVDLSPEKPQHVVNNTNITYDEQIFRKRSKSAPLNGKRVLNFLNEMETKKINGSKRIVKVNDELIPSSPVSTITASKQLQQQQQPKVAISKNVTILGDATNRNVK
eukprot:TRINITY_DN5916_c0_g1_i1.p1 TRINITY_DN5916_c0_g1~~TRINITY_DN5916_c0_g1_i1.p1  ORF type:complete len:459 (-),score=111.94 TRINITY_DN5916_c0_g1_i1:218-1594(-)